VAFVGVRVEYCREEGMTGYVQNLHRISEQNVRTLVLMEASECIFVVHREG